MDSPAPQRPDIAELQARLKEQRALRAESLSRLKRTVQKATEDIGCGPPQPALPPTQTYEKMSDPGEEPDPDALENAQQARRDGLSALKKTAIEAIHVVRSTVLMDSRQLAARLTRSDEDSEGSEGSGSGSGSVRVASA